MQSDERTFTVTTDDAVPAIVPIARRQLVVVALAGELLTYAESVIEIWRAEA